MARALLILLVFLAPTCWCYNSSMYSDTRGLGWKSIISNDYETDLAVKSRTQNVDTWYSLVYSQINTGLDYRRLSVILWDDYNEQVIWSVDKNLGRNSSISLHQNGDLVLENEINVPVWFIFVPNATNLHMSKDGYMELRNGQNKSLWSSFSSPTNCLVCGQALTKGGRLVSGNYSFEFDSSKAWLSYNMQYAYKSWTVGNNASLFAALCCDASGAYLQIRSDVGNISETGYLLSNWVECGGGSVLVQILSLSVAAREYVAFASLDNGFLSISKVWKADKISTPESADSCTIPNSCGSYGLCKNGSCSGCVLDNTTYLDPLDSQNNASGCKLKHDSGRCEMITEESIDFYHNPDDLPNLKSISEIYCRKSCADSSTCKAAFYQRQQGSCFVVEKVNSLRYANQTYVAFFKLCRPKQISLRSMLGLILGSVAALSCFFVLIIVYMKRKNKEDESEAEDCILASCLSDSTLRKFSFHELGEITRGFSEKLGEGGFGTVYKGLLADGKNIAVKILHESNQEAHDFCAEISALSRVRHLNLVQLLGFGTKKSKRALVYEYMPNGTLDQWLMAKKSEILSWEGRTKIAIGSAKGMAYLHEECPEKILHLDVKPQNILLDEDFGPKVADFGLSRLVDRNESGVFMTTIRGTPGYLSPELCTGGKIGVKSDVFSFGVVLLQIVSGANLSNLKASDIWDYNDDMIHAFVDDKLGGSFCMDEAKRMFCVAMLCINPDPELRPFMSAVVQMLEGKESIPHALLGSPYKKSNVKSLIDSLRSSGTLSLSAQCERSYQHSLTVTIQGIVGN